MPVLNSRYIYWGDVIEDPVGLSQCVISSISNIYVKYCATKVGWKEFCRRAKEAKDKILADPLYKDYVKIVSKLKGVKIRHCTHEAKLAFFLNIHNALLLHGFIAITIPNGTMGWYNFSKTASYYIEDNIFTLLDIEHSVLRKCSSLPDFPLVGNILKDRLELTEYALDVAEPYVTFGLYYNTPTSPSLRVYSTKGIYEELACAAREFLGKKIEIKANKRSSIYPYLFNG